MKYLIAVKIKSESERISAAALQPISVWCQRLAVHKLPEDQNWDGEQDTDADYRQHWHLLSPRWGSTAPLSASNRLENISETQEAARPAR